MKKMRLRAMSSLQNYINYLVDVLGVKHVFMDRPANDETLLVNRNTVLLVSVENFETYTASELELLNKMLTALQFDMAKIQTVSYSESAPKAPFQLYLLDDIQTQKAHLSHEFVTFSPRVLLKNAALKKQAWGILQRLISLLNKAN